MKYVISDIHGEFEKLDQLINAIKHDSTEIIFLGDYIDKGPDSKMTLDFLQDLSKSIKCVFLLGDHEYAWLDYLNDGDRYFEFILKYGGISTLESYFSQSLNMEEAVKLLKDKDKIKKMFGAHIKFIEEMGYFYEVDKNYMAIHAGINPNNANIPLDKHLKEEMVFIRNAFLASKFLYDGRKIIFGHTAFREPYCDQFKIGIDTGATYKEEGYGKLTAFNVDRNEFISHDGNVKKTGCAHE